MRMDDTIIDYTSRIGLEDKKRRFSVDVVDIDLKDRKRLQKLYRHIHRRSHCNQQKKGTLAAFPLNSASWRRERERSKSECSGLLRERGEERGMKDAKRSQSVFPQCSISEDEETELTMICQAIVESCCPRCWRKLTRGRS
jgi:hypothetical protein